jgi:hypothetical protein
VSAFRSLSAAGRPTQGSLLSFDGILRRTRPAVSTPVSSAVSRSAHHDAMARLHSTSRDRPASASSRRPWRRPVARPRGTSDVHARAAARVLNRIVWAGAERERRLSGAELSVEEWVSGISPTAPTASGMDLGEVRCNLGEHTPLPRVCAASDTTWDWTTAAVIDRGNRSEPLPSPSRQRTPARIRER